MRIVLTFHYKHNFFRISS